MTNIIDTYTDNGITVSVIAPANNRTRHPIGFGGSNNTITNGVVHGRRADTSGSALAAIAATADSHALYDRNLVDVTTTRGGHALRDSIHAATDVAFNGFDTDAARISGTDDGVDRTFRRLYRGRNDRPAVNNVYGDSVINGRRYDVANERYTVEHCSYNDNDALPDYDVSDAARIIDVIDNRRDATLAARDLFAPVLANAVATHGNRSGSVCDHIRRLMAAFVKTAVMHGSMPVLTITGAEPRLRMRGIVDGIIADLGITNTIAAMAAPAPAPVARPRGSVSGSGNGSFRVLPSTDGDRNRIHLLNLSNDRVEEALPVSRRLAMFAALFVVAGIFERVESFVTYAASVAPATVVRSRVGSSVPTDTNVTYVTTTSTTANGVVITRRRPVDLG